MDQQPAWFGTMMGFGRGKLLHELGISLQDRHDSQVKVLRGETAFRLDGGEQALCPRSRKEF